MAPENLSGVPPQVTLSGLDAGPGGGGFSGATQQGLGGAAFGGLPFGGTGGPDLLQLLQAALSGAGGDVGVGVGDSLTAGLGAGAFGQGVGGLGAGAFGQQFGQAQPGYIAGQTTSAGPEGAGAGSVDPLAVTQKILGLLQKGSGLLPTVGTASPTMGDSGVSLSDQLRSQEEAETTSSPSIGQLSSVVSGATTGLGGGPARYGSIGGGTISELPLEGGGSVTSLANMFYNQGMTPEAANYFAEQVAGLRGYDASFEALGGGGGGFSSGAGGLTSGTGVASPVAGQAGSPGVNLSGVAGGGLGGALGILNLIQALQGGNAQQGVAGGLQSIGGLANILQGAPELAQALGISPGVAGAAGAGIGGLGGLLGLASGIQGLVEGTGSPLGTATQLGGGALGVYNALQNLGLLSGGPGLGGALASYAPGLASALANTFGSVAGAGGGVAGAAGGAGGAAAGSGAAAASAALSGAAGAAAPIIAAIISYFGAQEESQARRSGWWNNPLIGNLYEAATRGVGATNTLADQIRQAGIQNVGTESLLGALQQMNQQIFPYYAYLQGGARPVSGREAAGSPGMQTKEEYAAAGQRATQNVYDLVSELSRRGVTPQQLGALQGPQGNQNWGETYLGGTPVQAALAPQLAAQRTPEMAFQGDPGLAAIQSGSWLSPTNVNTVTGGPVLSMLAALNPQLYGQVGGQLSYADPAVQAEIARQQEYANMINQQALQEFTSGGG